MAKQPICLTRGWDRDIQTSGDVRIFERKYGWRFTHSLLVEHRKKMPKGLRAGEHVVTTSVNTRDLKKSLVAITRCEPPKGRLSTEIILVYELK